MPHTPENSDCTVHYVECPECVSPTGISVEKHRVAVREWKCTKSIASNSASDSVPLICVHGLSRNGSDFDYLAKYLSTNNKKNNIRVLSIDIAGRGKSDCLSNSNGYNYFTYASDVRYIIEKSFKLSEINYLGTSMGGLIAFMLFAQEPPNFKINTLIVNDIGPFVPKEQLQLIAERVCKNPRFDSMEGLGQYCKEAYAGFGIRSDEHWDYFIKNSAWSLQELGEDASVNKFSLAYDKKITEAFAAGVAADVNVWPIFSKVQAVNLVVIRGIESLILPKSVALEMIECRHENISGKRLLREVEGAGHAPALMTPAEWEIVCELL